MGRRHNGGRGAGTGGYGSVCAVRRPHLPPPTADVGGTRLVLVSSSLKLENRRLPVRFLPFSPDASVPDEADPTEAATTGLQEQVVRGHQPHESRVKASTRTGTNL